MRAIFYTGAEASVQLRRRRGHWLLTRTQGLETAEYQLRSPRDALRHLRDTPPWVLNSLIERVL